MDRRNAARLPTDYPRIRGVLWFDKYVDGDWPIETSPAATGAFAAGIQAASYLANVSVRSAAGPIPPPA